MNRAFLELYNRELQLLYERSKQFAEEFPGVAERLGGLTRETMDPGLTSVLQGSAFMAARVQLKLKSEFAQFTSALLDQLLPNYQAPIPATTLVQAAPPYEDPGLVEGRRFGRGDYLDAVYVEKERRVACRFRLRSDLVLWPLHLEAAEYYAAPAPLHALGLEVAPGIAAGLRLGFRRLSAQPGSERGNGSKPEGPVKDVKVDSLPVHLLGSANDAAAVYEQLFAHCRRITIRYLDAFGDPRFLAAPLDLIEQVGFGEQEFLSESDDRVFSGFNLLLDFFTFPNKFLGFRLRGLRRLLAQIDSPAFDLIFEFSAAVPRLQSVVRPEMFALYTVPIVNLFEMNCSRVPIRRNEHEHHVVPDRSRTLDFEAHRIIDVYAHYPGRRDKVPVFPLYSQPTENVRASDALYYTARRLPRRRTSEERRAGAVSAYVGSELFISLYEPSAIDDRERVRELSVRCLASNRHLTDQLPVGEAGADFYLVEDTTIPLRCVSELTKARESLVTMERRHADPTAFGATQWKLITFLALNHLGIVDHDEKNSAGGLRELLSLFADLSDVISEQRIRGIESVSSRPIVRRLRQKNGFNAARGVEITVTLDEKAFEGIGVFLLGAVLDRFFAEYTSINSFTETVIETRQRGVIKRWAPRAGMGRLL
ncbi:type VI secretion system baseplate subunit TssF [Mesorhizobium sp. BAC0120]|uniref:type VI secretion system baseplate subunit TssF n=1 Tax=Mesorhizobium sp. BAC0120 TaxID=3090670 RepID=UPI00298C6187|nr:type VI secretion system baseplate subunit TssF [Mesorhizobium sp. BAC0120]MDW6025450.1 type VI secretion system baseplate subunit TssF [Mesorhizobium sp. BAC0120]